MFADSLLASFARLFRRVGLSLFCLAGLTSAARAESVGLVQLDLSKVQLNSGDAVSEKQLRRDESLILPAGSNFWIDLHGAAEMFTATLVPVIGSGTQPAQVRIHTL